MELSLSLDRCTFAYLSTPPLYPQGNRLYRYFSSSHKVAMALPARALSLSRLQHVATFCGQSTFQGLECSSGIPYFDICPVQGVKQYPSVLLINEEKRKEQENQQYHELRPGMILIKNYVHHNEQVEIIKECQKLGIGPGGFYQPAYTGGKKLRILMMCLGKHWNPDNYLYENTRPNDGAKPPGIPDGFKRLVERTIQDSHAFIKQISEVRSVEAVLPKMTPDVCLVNFYREAGRLGLHQDQSESQESLSKGVPIVSFSFGDSAEFLYGDDRKVDKAEKVVLESGDVVIFGGKSRNVFHGVSHIFPETAPKLLVNETNLIPGRLNLSFRQT